MQLSRAECFQTKFLLLCFKGGMRVTTDRPPLSSRAHMLHCKGTLLPLNCESKSVPPPCMLDPMGGREPSSRAIRTARNTLRLRTPMSARYEGLASPAMPRLSDLASSLYEISSIVLGSECFGPSSSRQRPVPIDPAMNAMLAPLPSDIGLKPLFRQSWVLKITPWH